MPAKHFLSENAGVIGAMGKKKVSGTRAHSHSQRHEAREREREREGARERDREIERYRERETRANPPQRAFQEKRKTNLTQDIFRELFSNIMKTNITKINSRSITYGKLRILHVIPEKKYAK